jgi:tRNA(adenine34) deaminase
LADQAQQSFENAFSKLPMSFVEGFGLLTGFEGYNKVLQIFPMKRFMTQSNEIDALWMKKALQLAEKASLAGEVPVGALLVQEDQLISQARNRREELKSPLGHAEMLTLHGAARKLGTWRLSDCTLYVTLEPCVMCAGALWQARIGRVVFGAADPKGGALGSLYQVHSDHRLNHRYEVTAGVMAHECAQLLRDFFRQRRK